MGPQSVNVIIGSRYDEQRTAWLHLNELMAQGKRELLHHFDHEKYTDSLKLTWDIVKQNPIALTSTLLGLLLVECTTYEQLRHPVFKCTKSRLKMRGIIDPNLIEALISWCLPGLKSQVPLSK